MPDYCTVVTGVEVSVSPTLGDIGGRDLGITDSPAFRRRYTRDPRENVEFGRSNCVGRVNDGPSRSIPVFDERMVP